MQIMKALRAVLIMTFVCGIVYPLAMTGISQIIFPYTANGSIIEKNGQAVGSELIGQEFKSDKYFSGRPSANGYDAANSGGTNYGAINAKLKEQVEKGAADVRKAYALSANDAVPTVMVTNSASGIDPHMTPEAIKMQAKRVAAARNMDVDSVMKLIDANTEAPVLGFMGDSRVNVLNLNLALDAVQGLSLIHI